MMTDHSDLILIVRVQGKTPELTERENWIRSLVSARVERVLKDSPQLPVSQGERVSFYASGGTMQFDSVTVEATESWAIPFEEGKRYLVFANVAEGRLLVGPSASYAEVVGSSTAQRLMRGQSDEIEGFGLDVAAARIEERLQGR
jgi:hypothetical protein